MFPSPYEPAANKACKKAMVRRSVLIPGLVKPESGKRGTHVPRSAAFHSARGYHCQREAERISRPGEMRDAPALVGCACMLANGRPVVILLPLTSARGSLAASVR